MKRERFSLFQYQCHLDPELCGRRFLQNMAETGPILCHNSEGQTNFSSYSSRSCVVMNSNKRGLVSSVFEATLVMSVYWCYFAKNWRNTCCAICRSKKDRDLLVQKGKNCICFPRTELRSGTFRRPCRPQNNIRFPCMGGSVWRCAGDCCMQGILLDCYR